MNSKGSIFFYFSNDLDTLFDFFSKKVSLSQPHARKKVVVPSLSLKHSLKNKLADSLGICMNVDFLSMQPLIHELITLFFPKVRIESHLDLALRIEKSIKEVFKKGFAEPFKPLWDYLLKETNEIDSLKLTEISDHLASLFVTYALYNENLKESFKKGLATHWQKILWERVMLEDFYYQNPFSVLDQTPLTQDESFSIYIFNTSFLPKPYYQLLSCLSSVVDINFFQLSLCSQYWTDAQSDFERSFYLKKLKSFDTKEKDLDSLEEYLLDQNSLLANSGRLNREFMKMVEEDNRVVIQESYVASKEILKCPSYEELLDLSKISLKKIPMTLLKALQTDLLLMVTKSEILELQKDDSIQVHMASTIQREVEILYHNIHKILDENDQLKPSDICIYVSHIENYIPYLESIFNHSETNLEISISNKPFDFHNAPLKSLFSIIRLLEDFSPQILLDLFHQTAFKNKFNLTYETLKQWESWIEEVGVSFGFDTLDQKNLMRKNYDLEVQETKLPSFEDLIQTLLKYLCSEQPVYPTSKNLCEINFSSADSINQLIEILCSLKKDLDVLKTEKLTLSKWASYLQQIFEKYFDFEKKESFESNKIIEQIDFYRSHFSEDKELFSFETLFYYLKKDLKDLEQSDHSSSVQCISIYGLGNSPRVDSKVMFVLGLNDMEFPRPYFENPLSLLKEFPKKMFHPLSMDYDRYLFLEMIGSVKEKLILSYLGYSTETYKETNPSILISEILSYLDKRFKLDGEKPSQQIIYKHPHLSFSKANFENKNYSPLFCALAKSYYGPKLQETKGVIKNFLEKKTISLSKKPLETPIIELSDLGRLYSNSIQFSLNKIYNVYLEKESLTQENQNFTLSNLVRALLKKELLSSEKVPKIEGFPKNIFGKIERENLESELIEIKSFLSENQLQLHNLFSVELRKDVSKYEKISPSHYIAPSLKFHFPDLGEVEIVGILENVTQKGLISFKNKSVQNIFSEWPKYLIYQSLKDVLPLDLTPSILFTKSKEVFDLSLTPIQPYMYEMIQFYDLNQKHILPFLPNWISYFTKLSPKEIIEKIQNDMDSPYFYNKYSKWLLNQVSLDEALIENFGALFKQLFHKTYPAISI